MARGHSSKQTLGSWWQSRKVRLGVAVVPIVTNRSKRRVLGLRPQGKQRFEARMASLRYWMAEGVGWFPRFVRIVWEVMGRKCQLIAARLGAAGVCRFCSGRERGPLDVRIVEGLALGLPLVNPVCEQTGPPACSGLAGHTGQPRNK